MKHEVRTEKFYSFTFTENEAQYLADLVQNNLMSEPESPEKADFRKNLFNAIRPPVAPSVYREV